MSQLPREVWIKERVFILKALIAYFKKTEQEGSEIWQEEYDNLFAEWEQLAPESRYITRCQTFSWASFKKGREKWGVVEVMTYNANDERIEPVFVSYEYLKANSVTRRLGLGGDKNVNKWLNSKQGLEYIRELFSQQKGIFPHEYMKRGEQK